MDYLVVYRTATHVGYHLYADEESAREDDHIGRGTYVIYEIANPEGWTQAEAKDLYTHGVEAMAPGWGLRAIEVGCRE